MSMAIDDARLTPEELAARWRVSVDTLRNWRSARTGPAYQKIGRKIAYTLADVQSWELKRTVQSARS
jgi:hypothetical protein